MHLKEEHKKHSEEHSREENVMCPKGEEEDNTECHKVHFLVSLSLKLLILSYLLEKYTSLGKLLMPTPIVTGMGLDSFADLFRCL